MRYEIAESLSLKDMISLVVTRVLKIFVGDDKYRNGKNTSMNDDEKEKIQRVFRINHAKRKFKPREFIDENSQKTKEIFQKCEEVFILLYLPLGAFSETRDPFAVVFFEQEG